MAGPPGPSGPPGAPGDSGFGQVRQDFVATLNQTVFTLPGPPVDVNKVVMVVDKFFFYLGKGIVSIIGNIVTWDQAGFFAMQAGQDVRIYY